MRRKLKPAIIPEVDDTGERDWDNARSFDGSQTGSIREIKTLLGAYEHFYRKVFRKDYSRPATPGGQAAIVHFQGQRQVTAVMFGLFQLDEISMPRSFEESENGLLFAKPTSGFPPPRTINVREVLHQLS